MFHYYSFAYMNKNKTSKLNEGIKILFPFFPLNPLKTQIVSICAIIIFSVSKVLCCLVKI